MKRKINEVGTGTLTISLPSRWAKENSVKKGDEIDLEVTDSQLVITKGERKKEKRKITIEIDNIDKMIINRYLHEFYREGVEEINIMFTNDKIKDSKHDREISVEKYLKKVVERFIGLEIISQTKGRIVLESFLEKVEPEKIEIVQRRVYYLLKDLTSEMIKAMDSDYQSFHNIVYDYHDNIVKFVYYYLRLLKTSPLPEDQKTRLFVVYMMIDKMLDKIRHTSEKVNAMKKITPKIKRYVAEIFEILIEQFDIIQDKDYSNDMLDKIVNKRYRLFKKKDKEAFTAEEYKVMYECKFMIDNIDLFIETRVSMGFDKMEEKKA